MSDHSNHVPSLESSVDSQLTENNENPPPIASQNSKRDEQEEKNTPQLSLESKSTCSNHKNIDWQKLAHKLREHNRKLLKRVFTLEQEIAEAQTRCKEKDNQFLTNNLLLEQQAEKLNDHQEEVARLLQEVENSQQKLQEKQVLTENLAKKLAIAQQETAKIERECTNLQDSNSEKEYNILVAQKQIQELQNRLDRQQQNTIKYRAALEKYISTGDFPQQTVPSSSFPQINNSEPIKSWSQVNSQGTKPGEVPDLLEVTDDSELSPLVAKKQSSSQNNSNWPAPEIAMVKKENQPKSIAAVKLPSFPRKSSL